MEQSIGLDDTSMLTNVGSITEDGPQDLSVQELHEEQDGDVTPSEVLSSPSCGQQSECVRVSTSVCGTDELSTLDDGASLSDSDKAAEALGSVNSTTEHLSECNDSHNILIQDEENLQTQCDKTGDSTSSQEPNVNSGVSVSKSTSSIYMDDGTSETRKPACKEKRPHRITMAERATQEALDLFGGCAYSSIPMRKIDLRMELEAEKKKRKLEQDGGSEPPNKRPNTRLQAAKEESQKMFKDISLASGHKKYSKVQRMKAESSRRSQDSKVTVRSTRVQRARQEALKAFEGAELDKIPSKKTAVQPESKPVAQTGKRLTRVERARLEALQAFGGSGLQDVMSTAKRWVARTFAENKESEDGEEESVDKENMEDSSEGVVAAADSE